MTLGVTGADHETIGRTGGSTCGGRIKDDGWIWGDEAQDSSRYGITCIQDIDRKEDVVGGGGGGTGDDKESMDKDGGDTSDVSE
jgi:hypothetical protein